MKLDPNFRFYYAQVGDAETAWYGTDTQAAVAGSALLRSRPEAKEMLILSGKVKDWEIDQKTQIKQERAAKQVTLNVTSEPAVAKPVASPTQNQSNKSSIPAGPPAKFGAAV